MVNTFLPYSDFLESAKTLDYRRLGKQRVECMQILNVLDKLKTWDGVSTLGWRNHPAVRMWVGYENSLKQYTNTVIQEWVDRGYNNNMKFYDYDSNSISYPKWLGDSGFHASHRSNLLRKDNIHYGNFGWTEPDNLEYIWPI